MARELYYNKPPENKGKEPLAIIKVQCGEYVGEGDILRFEDKYGRF